MIFGNFRKCLEILSKSIDSGSGVHAAYPGWMVAASSGGARGAREVAASARGGAAGRAHKHVGNDASVVSTDFLAIGNPQTDFGPESKKLLIIKKKGHLESSSP